jgi:hypothetical protein
MKISYLLLGIALAGASFAQSRSSFQLVDSINGVTVTESNNGLRFLVAADANPFVVFNGQSYRITDIFGFWALSNDDDLIVRNSDIGVWRTRNNNSGPGGIGGWSTNPNTGIRPNQSFVFDFEQLSFDRVEQFGFHLRVDGQLPDGSDTFYATVPEPASMTALALGLATMLRRRRATK